MKIFIDLDKAAFLRRNIHAKVAGRLVPWLESLDGGVHSVGYSIKGDPKKYDVQLGFTLFRAKTSLPSVLRLDGVYYDEDTDYYKRNKPIRWGYRRANGVIYQSFFCKFMCERYLAAPDSASVTAVIHNGVEDNSKNFVKHDSFNVITSGTWRRHKRLKEIIEIFLEFSLGLPDTYLHIFGDLIKNVPIEHPQVIYHGKVKYTLLKKFYTMGDAFIHLSKRDCCPNAVVEAIGAGIPVVTSNGCGGATEMCEMTPGCIICDGDEVSIDPCYPYREEHNILSDELKDNLLHALSYLYVNRYRVHQPPALNIRTMANQYLGVLRQVAVGREAVYKEIEAAELRWWKKKGLESKGEKNRSYYGKLFKLPSYDFSMYTCLDVGSGMYPMLLGLNCKRAIAIDPLFDKFSKLDGFVKDKNIIYYNSFREISKTHFVDVTFCLNTLDHAQDPTKLLDEIHKALKPRGLLFIYAHLGNPLGGITHPHYLFRDDYLRLLDKAGFSIINEFETLVAGHKNLPAFCAKCRKGK